MRYWGRLGVVLVAVGAVMSLSSVALIAIAVYLIGY